MNKAEKILGYQQSPKNILIPLILPVVGNMGSKLHRMILNATRYSLFIDLECKKAKSNESISFDKVQRQLLSHISAKSIFTLFSNSQVLTRSSKFNSSTHLSKMLAPNMHIDERERQQGNLFQD